MRLVRVVLKLGLGLGTVAWLLVGHWYYLGFGLLCAIVLFVALCGDALPDPETEGRLRDLSRDNHRACPYKLEPRSRRDGAGRRDS